MLPEVTAYVVLRCAGVCYRRKVRMSKAPSSDSKNTLYCSFCGKSQHELRKLIAGPTVHICNECVELCMDIVGEVNNPSLVRKPAHERSCSPARFLIGKPPAK